MQSELNQKKKQDDSTILNDYDDEDGGDDDDETANEGVGEEEAETKRQVCFLKISYKSKVNMKITKGQKGTEAREQAQQDPALHFFKRRGSRSLGKVQTGFREANYNSCPRKETDPS